MVKHTAVCDSCGGEFAYDAPVNPVVTPDYCSSGCAKVPNHD